MARKPRRRRRRKKNAKQRFAMVQRMSTPNYGKMRMTLGGILTGGHTTAASRQTINALINPRSMSFCYSPNVDAPTVHQSIHNFAKLKDLWDEYRPYYMVVKYVPSYDKDNPGNATVRRLPSLAVGFDKDNSGFLNLQGLRNLKGAREVDLTKRWTFKQGIPRYISLNQVNANVTTEGWNNMQNEGDASSRCGGLGMIGTGNIFPTPTADFFPVGTLDIDVYYEVRSRADTNVDAYFGVHAANQSVISDLPLEALSHEALKAAVPAIKAADGIHPF